MKFFAPLGVAYGVAVLLGAADAVVPTELLALVPAPQTSLLATIVGAMTWLAKKNDEAFKELAKKLDTHISEEDKKLDGLTEMLSRITEARVDTARWTGSIEAKLDNLLEAAARRNA